MKIGLVEDDEATARFIARGLTESGFTVDTAQDGRSGLGLLLSGSHDAAIVDIGLPVMDGLALIAALRNQGSNLPILILSARHSVDDRVRGFQQGGDDYLVKPFAFSELLARLQALLRRSSGRQADLTQLVFGDIKLDRLSHQAWRAGRLLELQPREYSLLELLLRNQGQVLTKTMILERLWNYDFDPQTNTVDVLVHRLRGKLELDGEKKVLHTVRGVGYVLR